MAELKLYNTLTRTKETFVPLDPAQVRMYVCGPTVYDYAHIGNARPVIVFDVLFRLLRHLAKEGVWDGGKGQTEVTYARNITDVDDKINARAAERYPELPSNEAIRKLTEETNTQFQADVAALGCLPPTVQPRATEHIDEMKALCERLVARGVAYVAEGHVLFSPEAMNARKSTWPVYGKLANRSLDEMIAGARVDVAPYKKGQTDFVLWKPSSENEPGWPSPCGIAGKGRPGWHIECSAMSMAKLLEPFGGGLSCYDPTKNTFDIHGGGIDLVFPHHENEIAQSCCAFGSDKMAQVWMHNGFLQVEGQKMSKSLGNFRTIREVLGDWPGEVARWAMLKTHYRQPIDWTLDGLRESRKTLLSFQKWFNEEVDPMYAGQLPEEFVGAICDDLNTVASIASLHKLANRLDATIREPIPEQAQLIAQFSNALRLLGFDALHLFHHRGMGNLDESEKANINSLITARLEARANKNWAESDHIRDELLAMGIQLKDGKGPDGQPVTTWEVKR